MEKSLIDFLVSAIPRKVNAREEVIGFIKNCDYCNFTYEELTNCIQYNPIVNLANSKKVYTLYFSNFEVKRYTISKI